MIFNRSYDPIVLRASHVVEMDIQPPAGHFCGSKSGKTMPCLPPMTGNGKFIPPVCGDDWGMVLNIVLPCFTHIR